MAAAFAAAIGSAAFEATAIATGSPDLKSGVAVSIGGVDPALAGKWVISGSRHEFGDGFYRTSLEFAGRQDRSVHGLLAQSGTGGGQGDRIYGARHRDRHRQRRPRRDRAGSRSSSRGWATTWSRGGPGSRPRAPGNGLRRGVVAAGQRRGPRRVRARRRRGTRTCWAACGTARTPSRSTRSGQRARRRQRNHQRVHLADRPQINFSESRRERVGDPAHDQGRRRRDHARRAERRAEDHGQGQGHAARPTATSRSRPAGSMKLEATGQMTIKGATVAIN